MLVDLIQTTTRDDIRLDGGYQAPATSTKSLPIDAFCLIHGTGSNFYSSSLLECIANPSKRNSGLRGASKPSRNYYG